MLQLNVFEDYGAPQGYDVHRRSTHRFVCYNVYTCKTNGNRNAFFGLSVLSAVSSELVEV